MSTDFPTRDSILNVISDPDVRAAYRSLWGCSALVYGIVERAARPHLVRIFAERAEWIAAAFNLLRAEHRPGRVENVLGKLTKVSALPPGHPLYGSAHEETSDLVGLFIRQVERASDRMAGFLHNNPAYLWPQLTAEAVVRMRIRLSVILKRDRQKWQRLMDLDGLLDREAVSASGGEATPPVSPPPGRRPASPDGVREEGGRMYLTWGGREEELLRGEARLYRVLKAAWAPRQGRKVSVTVVMKNCGTKTNPTSAAKWASRTAADVNALLDRRQFPIRLVYLKDGKWFRWEVDDEVSSCTASDVQPRRSA